MTLVLLAAMPMTSLAQTPTAAETDATTPDKPVFALGNPFVDNAIFQQQMEVPIWGTARPGTKVRVTLGEYTGTSVNKADGVWRVKLPAMKADPLTSVNTASGRSFRRVRTNVRKKGGGRHRAPPRPATSSSPALLNPRTD